VILVVCPISCVCSIEIRGALLLHKQLIERHEELSAQLLRICEELVALRERTTIQTCAADTLECMLTVSHEHLHLIPRSLALVSIGGWIDMFENLLLNSASIKFLFPGTGELPEQAAR
jgi:hypothetical protein